MSGTPLRDPLKGHSRDQVDIWPYRTTNGHAFDWIRPKGKGTKGWRSHWGIKDTVLPLDLPDIDLRSPVIVTEGERGRDFVARIGFRNVTCGQGGSSNISHQDWSAFRKVRAVLCPDDDPPGYRYMLALSDILTSQECEVKWIDARSSGFIRIARDPHISDPDMWA